MSIIVVRLNGISKTDVPSVNEQITELVRIIRNVKRPPMRRNYMYGYR